MLFSSVFPKEQCKVVMMFEVLGFPSDTNDVVNCLDTMERKMESVRERREHQDSGIPQDRHRDSSSGGRTHLIMNSHRLRTFQDIKTEVTNIKPAQSAVMARSHDAMDVDAFVQGSKGASKGFGTKQDSESVLVLREEGSSSIRLAQEEKRTTTVESRKFQASRRQREQQQQRVQRVARWVTCRRIADRKKRVHSKLATSWQRRHASKWQAKI